MLATLLGLWPFGQVRTTAAAKKEAQATGSQNARNPRPFWVPETRKSPPVSPPNDGLKVSWKRVVNATKAPLEALGQLEPLDKRVILSLAKGSKTQRALAKEMLDKKTSLGWVVKQTSTRNAVRAEVARLKEMVAAQDLSTVEGARAAVQALAGAEAFITDLHLNPESVRLTQREKKSLDRYFQRVYESVPFEVAHQAALELAAVHGNHKVISAMSKFTALGKDPARALALAKAAIEAAIAPFAKALDADTAAEKARRSVVIPFLKKELVLPDRLISRSKSRRKPGNPYRGTYRAALEADGALKIIERALDSMYFPEAPMSNDARVALSVSVGMARRYLVQAPSTLLHADRTPAAILSEIRGELGMPQK